MKTAPDFSEVIGQPDAIDAAMFAVERGNHLLLLGPPGTAKTMIARRVAGLLSIDEHARRWLAAEYEGAGLGPVDVCVPFRAPHHTISQAALVGSPRRTSGDLIYCRCGQAAPTHPFHQLPRDVVGRVGEVGLARFGVLMLDELTEFHAASLRALGSKMREMGASAPMIVAASNRCYCGWFGMDSEQRPCVCTEAQRARYQASIDAAIKAIGGTFTIGYTDPVSLADMRAGKSTHCTADMRARIARAGGAS